MLKLKGKTDIQVSQNGIAEYRNYRKAIDIEELLRWTYQDQAADAVSRKIVAGLYPAGCRSNLLAIERNGLLGTKIDCAGAGVVDSGDLHPDAEATHDAVRTLKPLWIGLVIDCAKTDRQPDWMPGEKPRPVPVLRGNGKPQMEYRDQSRTKPVYCLVRYDPEPEHLEFVRSVYIEWWDALAVLVRLLQDLGSHEVSGPSCPREPWRTEAC